MKRYWSIVGGLTAVPFLAQTLAYAYPADVFVTAPAPQAPASGGAAPANDAAGHRVGADGAAEYSIPLPVAPNRQDMVPQLALSYSSRNAVRGGVASGWTLDIPVIQVDTSRGILAQEDYRSSLSRGRLVRVGPEALVPSGFAGSEEFRAREDGEGTRYVRVVANGETESWRAYATDGRIYYFGETPESQEHPHAGTLGTTPSAGRFFVNRIVDRFGNEIVFNYETVMSKIKGYDLAPVPVDIALVSVEYGGNQSAGLDHHARVELGYHQSFDLCQGSNVPIGAQFDYRSGYPLFRGARRLDEVRLQVKENNVWTERRRLDLKYDESELDCSLYGTLHAPLRLLTSVTEAAAAPGGTWTAMPPVTFEYGRLERAFTREVSYEVDLGSGQQALSTDKGGGWPTLDGMLLDLDGDGALDSLKSRRFENGLDSSYCEARWRKNAGGAFGTASAPFGMPMADRPENQRFLPVAPWDESERTDEWTQNGREDCSLSAQVSIESNESAFPNGGDDACGYPANYLSYRFMDVTGDGLPDLVTGLDVQRGRYRPERDDRLWPDTYSCQNPLECECIDKGSCLDSQGNEKLCKVIDAEPLNVVYLPQTPQLPPPNCYGLCSAGLEGSVADDWATPVIGLDVGDELRYWVGSERQRVIESIIQSGTGETSSPRWKNPFCQMFPEIRCGHYVLRVYDNLGNGEFASQPRLVSAPVPLETDRPTSTLGAGRLAASSSWHGFIDIDGDGTLDAIYRRPIWDGGGAFDELRVFRGGGYGDFDDDSFSWPANPLAGEFYVQVSGERTISWPFNPLASPLEAREDLTGGSVTASFSSVTLEDINGDGLPDLVDGRANADISRRVRVLFNNGRGFEPRSPWYDSTVLHEEGNPYTLEYFNEEQQWSDRVVASNVPSRAFSRTTIRMVDIDADGLVDIVRLPKLSPDSTHLVRPFLGNPGELGVYLNVGDGFVRAVDAPVDPIWQALARIRVTSASGGGLQGSWQVVTDFVDLDGDGLAEAVVNNANETTSNGECRVVAGIEWVMCDEPVKNALTDPLDGQALRALRRVTNGKGAKIRFDYASVRTSGRVPHPVWTVTAMTVSPGPDADGNPSPEAVTSFAYEDAEYNADLDEKWAFRGFGVVEITAPSSARSVSARDFAQDYAGLVVDERVYDRPADPWHAHTIVTRTYEERRTFESSGPDDVVSYHLAQEAARTCDAAQDEAACESDGALVVTTNTWETLTAESGGEPVVHVLAATETSPGYGQVEGARGVTLESRLVSADGNFWLLTDAELAWSRGPSGGPMNEGETYTLYDASNKVPLQTQQRVVAGGAELATVTREFDLTTGNLIGVQSPNDLGTQLWSTVGYDSTETFVALSANELGHAVASETDPATGVVYETRGPNQKSCSGCPGPIKEGSYKTIDGFGRTLKEFVFLDDAAAGYVPREVARYAYQDAPNPRTRVTEERIISGTTDPWTKHETELDGLGRTAIQSTYELGAIASQSRSFYDAVGNLVLARVPKPSGFSVATVEWRYAYDALGRMIAEREPSRPGCLGALTAEAPFGWCGTRRTYDGLTVTTEDVTGTAGGQAGRTRTTHDALGRLVLVEEELDGGSWATTQYEHDSRDAVTKTTSPDGVVTDTTYDLLGRRTQVTRAGKTWQFGYDLNGNIETARAPVPPGDDPTSYVTVLYYDELDRVERLEVAPRGLSSTEIAMLGDLVVERDYDENDNGIGRLTRVENGSGSVDYKYQARGLVSEETHTFSILWGQFEDVRSIEREYLPSGLPKRVAAADSPAATERTNLYYHYNTRGTPQWAGWSVGPGNESFLYIVARYSSGLPYRQYTWENSALTHDALRGYDDAGRPSGALIRAIPPGATTLENRAYESFAFDGAGDVKTATTQLTDGTFPPVSHIATYTYDRMHRLVSATAPRGYQGSFTYSPGGRITSASVSADPSAVRVHPRNVSYVYGGDVNHPIADPDAPIALENNAGPGNFMEIDYDLSGNAIQRNVESEGEFEHLYDGLDRQRSAVNPDGSMDIYLYDPNGLRSVVVTSGPDGTVERAKWTVGEAEIHYDGDGEVEKEIAYASLDGSQIRIVDHQEREYLYHDSRGHLLAAFDEAGNMKAGFRYGPYGELLEEVGSDAASFERRFNDKERDETTGLTYYGYRYFDERSLTWTQADPMYRLVVEKAGMEPRRASLYAFSLGNPVNMVDPDGADGWSVNSGGKTLRGSGYDIPVPVGRSSVVLATQSIVVTIPDGNGGTREIPMTLAEARNYTADTRNVGGNTVASVDKKYGNAKVTSGSLIDGMVEFEVNGQAIIWLRSEEKSKSGDVNISKEPGLVVGGSQSKGKSEAVVETGGGAGVAVGGFSVQFVETGAFDFAVAGGALTTLTVEETPGTKGQVEGREDRIPDGWTTAAPRPRGRKPRSKSPLLEAVPDKTEGCRGPAPKAPTPFDASRF